MDSHRQTDDLDHTSSCNFKNTPVQHNLRQCKHMAITCQSSPTRWSRILHVPGQHKSNDKSSGLFTSSRYVHIFAFKLMTIAIFEAIRPSATTIPCQNSVKPNMYAWHQHICYTWKCLIRICGTNSFEVNDFQLNILLNQHNDIVC